MVSSLSDLLENPTARTLDVLIRRPLTVAEGDPVLLDHSSNDQPLSSEANAKRAPAFSELANSQPRGPRIRRATSS